MRYQALNWDTNEVICESTDQMELQEQMEFCFPEITDWNMVRIPTCRKCEKDAQERHDYYGISTGYWCESCYNSSKYAYRRDAYDPYNDYGTR